MSRRQARERALQVLFQVDLGNVEPDEAFSKMDGSLGKLKKNEEFAQQLVSGTLANLMSIDRVIEGISKDWNIKRMANVDRNIMRLALFEILYCKDIPNNVSVNEAIELGKIFGSEESAKFINGILGRVVEKPEIYQENIEL
ncbi:MAG: hypothetical protein A4E52_00205 [Pelotomaculum sp. PtaB.Bin013]|uniref:Transcription antitermination protein NusB n=1 Tax=Pelotomaculum isophthalicicum JI TaxID=947010 RepID=A0A9X4H0U0_9FIRM|nr:transcription antitermination factor NusB [Pelotomaculum isophthalicicum]MDF9407479.1 transcription antitermination factor NusB [Pelotomaculum isophthalicicum JI]MDF9407485.1 transcription antitermination factor NusB [Pelotomaculum isophthalicicum JI]OPX91994.1 MAG: hypothetical protein A4E52_00205 [Pelotomaculum sp. PtaB.Bin013]